MTLFLSLLHINIFIYLFKNFIMTEKHSENNIVEIGKALIYAIMTVAIIGIMFTKDYIKLAIPIFGLVLVGYIIYKLLSKTSNK